MTFRTIDENATNNINKYGIRNSSFSDIANAYNAGGIKGVGNSLSSFITSKDLSNIKEFNRLVSEEGVSSQTAWYKTMQTSSNAAKELFDNEENLVKSGNSVVLSEKAISTATNTMTFSAKAGQVALKGLALAGNMVVGILAGFVISKAIEGLDNLVHAADNAKESAEGFASSFSSMNDEFSSNDSKLSDLQKQYDELSKGVNSLGENVSLTTDQYDEYKQVVSEISDMMPSLLARYDDEGNKIGFVQGKLSNLNAEYDKYKKNKAMDLVNGENDNGDSIKDVFDNYQYQTAHTDANGNVVGKRKMFGDSNYEKIVALQSEIDSGYNGIFGQNKLTNEDIEKKTALIQKYQSEIDASVSAIQNALSAIAQSGDEYYKLSDQEQQFLDTYINSLSQDFIDANNLTNETNARTFINSLINDIESGKPEIIKAYNDLFSFNIDDTDLSPKEVQKKVNELIQQLAKALGEDNWQDLKIRLGFEFVDDNVKNYEDTINRFNDPDKIKAFFNEEGINTASEVKEFYDVYSATDKAKQGIYDADVAMQEWKNHITENTASATASLTSFEEAWMNLKGADDSDLKGAADDLLELAEAGQLTENALGELAGGQKLMDDTGLSAEALAEKINGLVNASTQLSSMSTQISKMSDMLADKKNGTVASASDLAGFDVSVRGLESWDEFERVMGDSTSTMDQCQEAANALATEWVNDGNFLSNLTDENKAYYETQLDQMGVANAQEIVENALAIARENEATQTEYATIATQHNSEAKSENEMVSTDLTNATASEIAQLLTEANVSEATKGKIVELWLAKADLNSTKINTASDVEQIVAIANAAGASVGYVNALKKALNDLVDAQTPSHKPSDLSIDGFNTINDWKNESNKSDFEKFADNMEKQQKQDKVDDLLSKLKQNIKGTQLKASAFKINPSGSKPYQAKNKSKGKESSSKKSKTEIDWIERKITIINNKIDAFATKANDTWSSWTSRSKALNSEMETTKKLLTSVYGISSKTQKKLNSQRDSAKNKLDKYVKKNSKVLTSSTIKKIKSGKLDTSKLSKKDKKVVEEYKKLQKDYNKKASKAKKASEKNPAADYYFAKANKVAKKYKLSPAIIKKIKNGAISISDYNESMANAIQKYQDYYDKGKDAQKSKKETKQKLNELAQQNFELIQSKWDSRIGYQENRKNAVSDALNLAQSKGKLIGTAYYTKQKGINNKEINKYKQEETELKKAMKGVKKYSEQWYQYKADLSEVHSKYVQLQADNAELQNSINELKFDRFDELINKFDDIIDESDFLIDLLDSDNLFNSDNGSITNDGITAMGLTAQNYDVYLAEAEQYKKQIADLEQMYKNGEIGLTQYNSQMREYQQGMRNSIKSANDAKKAVIDYVKQGLDAQNEALSKSIDKQKELLESEKDLHDFQSKISDQNKNIANLRKQIVALEGDSSESNRKKLQQLKSDLKDAEKEQSDTLYDRSVSDQEKALDDMLTKSQEAAENYLKNTDQVFVDALGYVNKNTSQVSQNLEKIAKNTGYDISIYITNAWKDSSDAVGTYESTLSSNVPKITSQIQLITNAWNAQCEAANKAAKASANAAAGGDETTKDTDNKGNSSSGSGNKSNTSSAKDIKAFIQKSLNKAGQKKSYYGVLNRYLYEKTGGKVLSVTEEVQLAKMLGVSVKKDLSGTSDRQKILNALKKKKIAFANGGVLGDLVKLSGEDGLFIGSAGESILTKEQTQALINFRPVIPQLNTMVDLMKNVPISSASQSPTYNIDNRTIVEGVATDQIVKQMEGVAQKQAENVVRKINQATYAKGVRK